MVDPSKLLTSLPARLRDELIGSYREITRNYAERRWEPAELNGGKFCEVVYTILIGYVDGSYSARASKPRDMVAACRGLEAKPPKTSRVGDRSVRILIPRVLLPLYEIRNNRGVGHIGGDVDPNMLDATSVLNMASWVFAELGSFMEFLQRMLNAPSTPLLNASIRWYGKSKMRSVCSIPTCARKIKPSFFCTPSPVGYKKRN